MIYYLIILFYKNHNRQILIILFQPINKNDRVCEWLSLFSQRRRKNDLIKKTSIPFNYNLNVIEEDDENIKNREDEHLSEEESLGYNSNYKLFQNNSMNKEHQNAKEKTTKRKLSTLSTTISQTDICSETNSFYHLVI